MELLLVRKVPVQKNLGPPGMDMERRMLATEEREGCCAGRRSSKYPSRQKGTQRHEGQGTEVGIQLQLPRLQSPLLPERPYLGRETREGDKASGWELPGLRGKLGLQHGERG